MLPREICYSPEMEIIPLEGNEVGALASVLKILRDGGVVAAPTDTVYGILGDAAREGVIRKMVTLKKQSEKPLPVFVKDIAIARKYAYISDAKVKFLERVWPGPVTVLFYHKEKLPSLLTPESDIIGLRIPQHPFLLQLLDRFDGPVAQTSANISGKPPATTLEEIKAYFPEGDGAPDLVVDAGTLGSRPSTVVDFKGERPMVVRTGMISPAELQKIFDAVV